MKFIETLKTELRAADQTLSTAEAIAREVEAKHQLAAELWKANRSKVLMDALLLQGEITPCQQKHRLAELTDLAEDAHHCLNEIYQRRDRIRALSDKFLELESRARGIEKAEQSPRLFRQDLGTGVMANYLSTIKLTIGLIKTTVGTAGRYVDTTVAEVQAAEEISILEGKLKKVAQAKAA